MKKIFILFILFIFLFSSCISMVSTNKKVHWALSNGYILATDCPVLEPAPERDAQPHPKAPTIIVVDSDGNSIPLTQAYLMETVIILFGTVEKYQVLVEIYEREYLNAGGQILPNLTLDELKALYKSRLAAIDSVVPVSKPEPELVLDGKYPMTGSSNNITIQQFELIMQAFEFFQENGDIE